MWLKRLFSAFAGSSSGENEPAGNRGAASDARIMPSKTAADLAAAWWRRHPERQSAVCDRCSGEMEHGSGYLRSPGLGGGHDLLCESCWYSHLGKESPTGLRELREAFKRRTPGLIDDRPSFPTSIGFDPPLMLDAADFRRLAESVGCGPRPDERPYGICRFCNQNYGSAGLVEWLVLGDDGSLRIAYGCRTPKCEGTDEISHYVSSSRMETVDGLVWGVADANRDSNSTAYPDVAG